jgi:hypothetical protein
MADSALSIDAILQHEMQPASWWLRQLQCASGDTRAIERAIRRVALRVHPDQNGGSDEANKATNILMHSVKDMLLSDTADSTDDEHAASFSDISTKSYSRQSEQMQMDAATRGLDPNSVAWAVALAKVCSYNAGHYLSSAYVGVRYKRQRADDAAETLAGDPEDTEALQRFQERVTIARKESAEWNAAVLPYRAAERPLDLGRCASRYDIDIVCASSPFVDSPEWVRLEKAIMAVASPVASALPVSKVTRHHKRNSNKRAAPSFIGHSWRRRVQPKNSAPPALREVIDLIHSDEETV